MSGTNAWPVASSSSRRFVYFTVSCLPSSRAHHERDVLLGSELERQAGVAGITGADLGRLSFSLQAIMIPLSLGEDVTAFRVTQDVPRLEEEENGKKTIEQYVMTPKNTIQSIWFVCYQQGPHFFFTLLFIMKMKMSEKVSKFVL